MLQPIRYLIPDLPTADEIVPYLRQIDTNKMYTNFGPLQADFVVALRQTFFNPSTHLTTTASGTAALHLALLSLKLKQDSVVLLPNYTFAATGLAAKSLGYTLALSCVTLDLQLTPEIVLQYLQSGHRVDVVIPVCPYGVAVDVAAWHDFQQRTGIPVIIDAAAALGNIQPEGRVICCYSLHATKSFGIGEGGLIAGLDAEQVFQCMVLANFGFNGSRSSESLGINAKLSEYHAAVGLAQIQRYQQVAARRREVHQHYLTQFALHDLMGTVVFQDVQTQPSNFILHVERHIIDDLIACLTAKGIEVHRGYYPLLSQMTVFKEDILMRDHQLIDDTLVGTTLALPFHTSLTLQDIEYIAQQLAQCIKTMDLKA